MFKKILAVFTAALMIALCIPFNLSAASTSSSTPFGSKGVNPVPLLVLVVSYDADKNGKDAYAEGLSTTNSSLPSYGEQWAHSEESYWSNSLFGDSGNTMKNYFKLMSNDKFWFTPVEETYGTANNGVVYVTLNEKHPGNVNGSNPTTIGNTRISALNAANEYIDFSKYDTDGNGGLSWQELSVVYIIAGCSTKFGMASDGKSVWRMGSFKQNGTSWHTTLDGVRVLSGSDGGKFAVVGEMQYSSQPLTFGSIAHELAHIIGANDLYTYGGYTWCGGPGDIALQGGGSGLGISKYVTAGSAPSAIDPYYLTWFGFQKATEVRDGTYTLYSRDSNIGDYNILKICTNNPKEYYLIENRYTTKSNSYDAIPLAARGIQIWHVDEGIMKSYTLPNCWKDTIHAPGLTPLYPNGNTGGNAYDAWKNVSGKNIFNCRSFKFAGSGIWYTAMTEKEAANYNFTIEILSAAGNEMQIRVSGFNPPTIGNLNKDKTIDTSDLTLLRKYIAGYNPQMNVQYADINGDGKIDTIDLTLLRKYIAGYPIKLGK